MDKKLRVGKIPYLNLFPIYHFIQTLSDCSEYRFIEGVPSALNQMLREGEIDISPSSSIEYIRNPHLYELIEGHSISCSGCIGSILLFSKKPIEELHGCKIYVTSQSETSIALLKIVLSKFCNIDCKLLVTDRPQESKGDAFFLIGDEALKINKKLSEGSQSLLVYDLGEIWAEHTNLPFVFALWIARKDASEDSFKKQLLQKFIRDLNNAKNTYKKNFYMIGQSASVCDFLSLTELISYWEKISYDLNEKHKSALELFKKYLIEISYLN